MNENDAYVFAVEEPTRWVFDGGPVWITGWFLAKRGAVFSDVRAVIDGVPWLGIFGLPREREERQHRGHTGMPHAGFSLRVEPPRGARELRLELLDAGHHWVEIWRTPIEVRRGPRRPPPLEPVLVPALLRHLLQDHRADPAAPLRERAAALVAAAGAVPLDSLPVPPFYGALEEPGRVGGIQFGKLKVEGWLIHREQRIVRLLGTTHPHVENIIAHEHRERPEAAALFPGHPYAARSQFFGMLDVDESVPPPLCVKIFADLEDGSRHLVWAKRIWHRPCALQERPLPEFSRGTLARTVAALVRGARDARVPLGRARRFIDAVRDADAAYRRDAPASLAHLRRPPPGRDRYAEWLRTNAGGPRLAAALAEAGARAAAAPGAPRVAILIDVPPGHLEHLPALIASLRAQHYPHWEAVAVVPRAHAAAAAQALGGEARGRVEPHDDGPDRIRALNAAAHGAAATHLALLDASSRLSPDALLHVAEALLARPAAELVYTDEDTMDEAGRRRDPAFKPDWSPTLALSGLHPGQLAVVRRDRFIELGSFRPEFDLIPWHDLLLRLADRLDPAAVVHIAAIGHHARAGAAPAFDPSAPAVEQARKALNDTARRRGWAAEAFLPEAAHRARRAFHQLRWDRGVLSRMAVTIVIPTRDKLHLLQECVEQLDETVDWRWAKLVIVDDHSRDADAVRYLDRIQRRTDLRCVVIRPPDPHAPFNYSRLVNLALPHVDTPLILHLNNDVNALEPGWLEEMIGWFAAPDVGVVGARLVGPEGQLNHTGIVLGPHGGLADTPLLNQDPAARPDVEWHAAAREVSAVTGACLLTRAELYRRLGGFDETDFGVAYNDVDYCLRVRAAGHRVLYTPQTKLMHWGSATRGVTFDEREHVAFIGRHRATPDPFLNPHLEVEDGEPRVRTDRCGAAPRAQVRRVLLITHNLNLEGAPLFLHEYATHLVREAGIALTVVSNQEGPLRQSYEELGAKIHLVDRHPIYAAHTPEEFEAQVAAVRATLPLDDVDVVVCNTLIGFWGIALARQAGLPSLLYVHESASPARFFEHMLRRPMLRVVEQAFADASRVLFLCRATRAYYEDLNTRDNFRLVTSWIQLDRIAAFQAAHTREELRRKHGIGEHEVVIANIGTVCERKGQHIFIRACEHFVQHQPGRGPFRFLMVGARPGIYLDLLTADLARLGVPNVTLVPETREAYDFFRLSDLFVCTSYEESFPRVVLEAMAFGTPIVTTDVHGIPEMVRHRAEAYLVRPGEVAGLSRFIHTCLAKERSGKSLAPTAYSRVLRLYDHRVVLPRHVDLLREVWLEGGRAGAKGNG